MRSAFPVCLAFFLTTAKSLLGAIPIVTPSPQVVEDGLALLNPPEAAAVKAGFNYQISCDHTRMAAFDTRDPGKTRNLDAALVVDQKAFVNAINEKVPSTYVFIKMERVDCDFWESREENGDVTPVFRVRWTFQDPFTGKTETLNRTSFGRKFSSWSWNSEKSKLLWVRGAAAGYQAASYKVAIALQERLAHIKTVKAEPNQSPQPTPASVTSPAEQGPRRRGRG